MKIMNLKSKKSLMKVLLVPFLLCLTMFASGIYNNGNTVLATDTELTKDYSEANNAAERERLINEAKRITGTFGIVLSDAELAEIVDNTLAKDKKGDDSLKEKVELSKTWDELLKTWEELQEKLQEKQKIAHEAYLCECEQLDLEIKEVLKNLDKTKVKYEMVGIPDAINILHKEIDARSGETVMEKWSYLRALRAQFGEIFLD